MLTLKTTGQFKKDYRRMKKQRGDRSMNEETKETQQESWDSAHPWLSKLTQLDEEEDSVDEVIRYTLDELRLA